MKKTKRIEKERWRKRDGGREGGYTYLASGSSRESRFSQRVAMILSYWLGYFLNMSCKQQNSIADSTHNRNTSGFQ